MAVHAASMARRLEEALTSHDLESLVALFADDYRCEWPCRPDRSFTGRGQVRTNWQELFEGIPDVRWALLRQAATAEIEWAEWAVAGTTLNGASVSMRGVTILGVAGDLISWSRFYLEPVVHDGVSVYAAVAATVSGSP